MQRVLPLALGGLSPALGVLRTLGVRGLAVGAGDSSQKPVGGVLEVQTDQQYQELLSATGPNSSVAILDFTAKIKFLKLDIDTPELSGIVQQNGITGVPTFIFLEQGKEVERVNGANLQLLKSLITKYAGQHGKA
ncbi:thioredoxin [Haematococcus lacustris]|uniref:Thioredoxin n=1 Tax=Haematococcus lacustris TaxID=44745 RepID=A0A699YZY6_HAELA|nr:thioredoxin [Haematococcus lacustris]